MLLVLFSSAFYVFLFVVPDAPKRWMSYSGAFMWCPGLAAIITLLVMRRNLRGLGWGWGGIRYYVLAYAIPLGFCLPVYLFAWLFGGFDRAAVDAARLRFGLPPSLIGDAALVLAALLLAPTGMIATLGEELGWRGFLVPRLATLTSFTKTSLITGAIWALWHYPVHFAVLPFYLPRLPVWYATICFTISVIAISFVYTWIRLRSGSVWPLALLHATSNTFQGAFEAATIHDGLTSYLTYEFGAGFALVIPIIAVAFWRRRREVEGR